MRINFVKWLRWLVFAVSLLVVLLVIVLFNHTKSLCGTMIEFDIHQNTDMILFSAFGEPPQFAIWLEHPVSHKFQTVFVTYRSATGDWVGKAECPVALPRWFEVHQQETNNIGLPTPDAPALEAVTGATPTMGHFKISTEVKPGSEWICWVEVNLAADYNRTYREYNETEGIIDVYALGQPSVIYRGQIKAVVGKQIIPELYGQTVPDAFAEGELVKPISEDVTTAKKIFKSIKISVVRSKSSLFK